MKAPFPESSLSAHQDGPENPALPGAEHGQSPSFTVPPSWQGQRLDKFLAAQLQETHSRQKIKELIEAGAVSVSGRTVTSAKTPLRAGATASIALPPLATSLAPEEGDLTILYRDEYLVLIDKPAGLTVHPCPSCPEGTLAHRLVAHFPEIASQEGFRPGIVHRLDKDTSGLLLAALTTASQKTLADLFARHEVEKTYLALVSGVPARPEGSIDMPIGRHPTYKTKMAAYPKGRPARSHWQVLEKDPDGRFSLVAVGIETGRTHQIRVHMAHLGHPLLGDALYRVQGKSLLPDPASRQMLHAWKLALPYPDAFRAEAGSVQETGSVQENASGTGPVVVLEKSILQAQCPPPKDFEATLHALGLRSLRVILTGMPGCGKSSLLAAFKEEGYPVFCADACVGQLYAPDGDGTALLARRFGERFLLAEQGAAAKEATGRAAPGGTDKVALGKAMAADSALRREVEALIHPLVFHALEQFWLDSGAHPLAVAEIPLYFESGRKDREAVVIGVHAPLALRKNRLHKNRGWSQEMVATMEGWQMPEEAKMAACTLVVDNAGSEEALAAGAKTLCAQLLDIREQRALDFAGRFIRQYR